jgi:hypothetical protein
MGEAEAARLLELSLAAVREPGFDATDETGKKYQIKTRVLSQNNGKANSGQLGSIRLKHGWDAVLLVILNSSFETQQIWQAERPEIEKALLEPGSKARNERGALSVSKFRNIGTQVWPKQ